MHPALLRVGCGILLHWGHHITSCLVKLISVVTPARALSPSEKADNVCLKLPHLQVHFYLLATVSKNASYPALS